MLVFSVIYCHQLCLFQLKLMKQNLTVLAAFSGYLAMNRIINLCQNSLSKIHPCFLVHIPFLLERGLACPIHLSLQIVRQFAVMEKDEKYNFIKINFELLFHLV